MTLPDFLYRPDDGTYRFVGHRIDLYHVVTRYLDGCTADTIADILPTLSLATIHKAIAFYLENRDELNSYIDETRAEIDRQMTLPQKGPTRDELLRRMATRVKSD